MSAMERHVASVDRQLSKASLFGMLESRMNVAVLTGAVVVIVLVFMNSPIVVHHGSVMFGRIVAVFVTAFGLYYAAPTAVDLAKRYFFGASS